MSKNKKIKKILLWSIIFFASFFFIFPQKRSLKSQLKEVSLNESFLENAKKIWWEPEFILTEKAYLKSFLPPALILPQSFAVKQEEIIEDKKEIIEYTVEQGDDPFSIAKKFNLSLNTVLWANNLEKNTVLKPGQKLIILPTDGLLHQVKNGDTLSEIALLYKAKIEDIVIYNNLDSPDDLFVGQMLIIPDGKMPVKKSPVNQPTVPLASNYLICPVSTGCRITQGLHWYNAVDFSNGKCGEPVLAAAGGKVQKVKYGWNGGAGNYVSILHPNGIVTNYYHLQSIFVVVNQEVSQGEIIGLMGKSGRSTGCHLHFEVYGALNPFAR